MMMGQNQEQDDVRKKWIQTYGEKNLVGGKDVTYEICYKGINPIYLREFPRMVEKLGFPVERRDADNIILVRAPSGKVPLQTIAALVQDYRGNLNLCINGNTAPISVDLTKAITGSFAYNFPEQKK